MMSYVHKENKGKRSSSTRLCSHLKCIINAWTSVKVSTLRKKFHANACLPTSEVNMELTTWYMGNIFRGVENENWSNLALWMIKILAHMSSGFELTLHLYFHSYITWLKNKYTNSSFEIYINGYRVENFLQSQ